MANIFTKVWDFVKSNPWKLAIMIFTVIAILVIAFVKPVQHWLGLRKPALTGHRRHKQLSGTKSKQLPVYVVK